MQYYGLTDIGKVRSQNQDYFYCTHSDSEGWWFAVVCDGMGGAKAGNIASKLAADVFSREFLVRVGNDFSAEKIEHSMRYALDAANSTVFDMSINDYECRGMGTTLVSAFVYKKQCTVINVGDSRAYTFSNAGLEQITHDHSYVQQLLDAGAISPAEAMHHKSRNIITRAVGTSNTVCGDIFRVEFTENSRLMLCSDGLVNMVDSDEIINALTYGNAESAGKVLVDLALQHGASDNTTVVIFDA